MKLIELIRPEDLQRMVMNRHEQRKVQGTRNERDFEPVVKLHIEGTHMLWLLTELDEDGIAFGLCQIHCAELGNVSVDELLDLDAGGIRVVQDKAFKPTTTLRGYAALARSNGGMLLL